MKRQLSDKESKSESLNRLPAQAGKRHGFGMTISGRVAAVSLAGVVCIGLASVASAQVTPRRLLDSAKEPQNWLMYSGDYAGHRFSALDQINTSNASSLVP